jgi:hypothetical protein
MKIHCDSRDDFVYSIENSDGEVWPYPKECFISKEKVTEIEAINQAYEESQAFLEQLYDKYENNFKIEVRKEK